MENTSFLERVRASAQYFTMGAAVLAGLVWVATLLSSSMAESLGTLLSVLVFATAAGGVAMGVLYLLHRLREK